jgi:hypothetical protein
LKKLLIAGAAVAALLSAGSASADDVFQGSASSAVAQQISMTTANAVSMPGLQSIANLTQITRLNNLQTLGTLPGNVSLITLSGHSDGNSGTAQNSTSNTFTLTGKVTPDCSFFVGNVNTTIDFGTIGIEARDNVGPASAFDMTAPATAQIQTNVAGCNTRNLVSVTKGNADGMRNASTSGYDPAQFTNKLPYSVAVAFNGSAPNSAAAQAGAFNVDASEQTDSQLHGAWKSVFTMNVNVPPPAESLLAGTYTDTVNVSLTVQP